METTAFDKLSEHVERVIEDEQRHLNSQPPFSRTTLPALGSFGFQSSGKRAADLSETRSLIRKCQQEAHDLLDVSGFAAVSRSLDSVFDAVKQLQKWDDRLEAMADGAFFDRYLHSPILGERYRARVKAVRSALQSDTLVEFAFRCCAKSSPPKPSPEHNGQRDQTAPLKARKRPDAWLHDAGSEPPQEFYRDRWLTGTKTEIGFALRRSHLPEVGNRQLSASFTQAASRDKSRIWCRDTQTGHIDVFLRHQEPRNDEGTLKALHDAEARLLEFRNRKPTEVGGSPRKPVRVKAERK